MLYPQTKRKILFCDIETTGVNAHQHGIHQLAGKIEIDGEVAETFDIRMAPHPLAVINPEALKKSKVTYKEIMAYQSMDIAYRQFYDIVTRFVNTMDFTDRMFIAGYNSQTMEKLFIENWLAQLGSKMWKTCFHNITLDISCFAAVDLLMKGSLPNTLVMDVVAAEYGIIVDREKQHEASYDNEIAIKIFKAIYDGKM